MLFSENPEYSFKLYGKIPFPSTWPQCAIVVWAEVEFSEAEDQDDSTEKTEHPLA